jgi:hypothetical protein
MNVNYRFFKHIVWGSIVLLLLIVMGCSSPAGPDTKDPAVDPPSQEIPDDEPSAQNPGGEQDEPDDEPSAENPGGEQDKPDDDNDGVGEGEGGSDEDGAHDPDESDESPVSGTLIIRIGEIDKSGGVYPDLSGIKQYMLDFAGKDGKTAESRIIDTGRELTVTLDAGEWELCAFGIAENESGKPPQAVIRGTATVTVPKGGTESVVIVPDRPAAENSEPGYLSWNIDYPKETVWEAQLTLSIKVGENNFIPYAYFNLNAAEKKIALPAGTYKTESRFLSHRVNYANSDSTEIVHIYPLLETKSNTIKIAENLFQKAEEFASLEDLKNYLASAAQNDQDSPYPVKIGGIDLSSKEATGDTLKTLYNALAGKYVTLDLSGCTGTQLIAASTASLANRKNIVALILPGSITEILENGFSGYTALKTAILPKVKILNYSAFKSCESLAVVSAPELETIADGKDGDTGAFGKCTALKTLYVPNLVTMGKYAVYGCSALTEAAFPKLRGVGGLAFKTCTALKSLALPYAAKIENSAFADTALENLILGATPPELGTSVFTKTFSQTGIIYVPANAAFAYRSTELPNWSSLKDLVKPLSEVTGI